MPINADKPHLWKQDILQSVDLFNRWFMKFAPKAFRDTRIRVTKQVEEALLLTDDLRGLSPALLQSHPRILPTLRMCTCPPLARDRLIGLSGAGKSLVGTMEAGSMPPRMPSSLLAENLARIVRIISRMLDKDILPWIGGRRPATDVERHRASTIVADRLRGRRRHRLDLGASSERPGPAGNLNVPTLAEVEQERLQAQERLDAQKNAAERNRAGQFATPPALAVEIATYVRELWKERTERVRFLDPALGTGSFYSALRQAFPADRIGSAGGVELDCRFAETAQTLWGKQGLDVVQADFTTQEAPARKQNYNLILTNPPYVRHHHIGREEKLRLQRIVARKLGIKLSGLAGLYCYFLLLADAWLADGGLGVWLIPSEFMDVNYGQAVKRYLAEHVKLLHIHRFCPADVQFSDALVSSAVVVFEKSLPPPRHTVRFTHGGTLLGPQAEQAIPLATLRRTRKWTNYPEASPAVHASNGDTLTLADLFTIKRGLATGANDFFIRPREEVASWRIPADFVKPILPSPRHLPLEIIEADPDGFPRLPKVLCLIDCDRPEHELRKRYPLFWNYLQTGKEHGIHEGYLASRRLPWYAQEKRVPSPFLCTYMGRTSNGRKPFRFLWNQSAALASNLYLLLFPKGPLQAALRADPQLFSAVFQALGKIDTDAFIREGRVYGGGLYKMEPKELGRLAAEPVVEAMGGWKLARQGMLFADR